MRGYNYQWQLFYYRHMAFVKKRDKEFKSYRDDMYGGLSIRLYGYLSEAVEVSTDPRTGLVNYNLLFIKIRKYLNKIRVDINKAYKEVSKEGDKYVKDVFTSHREETEFTLKEIGAKKIVVREDDSPDIGATFNRTKTASFKKHLEDQFKQGHHPETMIKTLSSEHVALVERHVMTALQKGKGFNWTREKVLAEMYPDDLNSLGARSMGFKVDRITRTAYRTAVNLDMTNFVLDNPDSFYGSRRTANGRPCAACIALDGSFYGPGEILNDHPQGQCILVPLTYPVEYLATGGVTDFTEDDFGPTLLENFYDMPEADQKRILGLSMFAFWKKEKIDLRAVVSKETNTPLPYYKVVEDAEKYGALSSPMVTFAKDSDSLNPYLDPADRASKNKVAQKYDKNLYKNKKYKGLLLTGVGEDLLDSNLPSYRKAQLVSQYNLSQGFDKMHWSEFNDFARDIGIYTRKGTNGRKYLIVPLALYNKENEDD